MVNCNINFCVFRSLESKTINALLYNSGYNIFPEEIFGANLASLTFWAKEFQSHQVECGSRQEGPHDQDVDDVDGGAGLAVHVAAVRMAAGSAVRYPGTNVMF
jgi:hypothetical protein